MTDNLYKRRKPMGTHRQYITDDYSFFMYGHALTRATLPARMACAAPVVALKIGKTAEGESVIYVPPVSPTAGGNCENIPQKHVDLFFADEAQRKNDEPDRRDFLWGHYCHDCPVREACFEYAMNYIDDGIWAGTTGFERRNVRGRMQGETPKQLNLRHEKIIKQGKARLRKGEQPLGG